MDVHRRSFRLKNRLQGLFAGAEGRLLYSPEASPQKRFFCFTSSAGLPFSRLRGCGGSPAFRRSCSLQEGRRSSRLPRRRFRAFPPAGSSRSPLRGLRRFGSAPSARAFSCRARCCRGERRIFPRAPLTAPA